MPQKKRKISDKAKKQVAPPLHSRLALKAVRLVEAHMNLNIAGNRLPAERFGIKAESNFGGDEAETVLVGNLKVTVGPEELPETPAETSTVAIIVTFQCVFDVDSVPKISSLSKEEISAVNSLVTMAAWPYARQFISLVTSSMGIPPLTLPLARMSFGDNTPRSVAIDRK